MFYYVFIILLCAALNPFGEGQYEQIFKLFSQKAASNIWPFSQKAEKKFK